MRTNFRVALTVTIIGLVIGGGIMLLGRNELLSQETEARETVTLIAGIGWGGFMAGLACLVSSILMMSSPSSAPKNRAGTPLTEAEFDEGMRQRPS
jgi:hypothetical protein